MQPSKRVLGRWEKGYCPNPNGRPKGSKNKITKAIRESLEKSMLALVQMTPKDIEAVSPEKRLDFTAKIFPYILKQKEIKKRIDKNIQISVSYSDEYKQDMIEDDKPKQIDNIDEDEIQSF